MPRLIGCFSDRTRPLGPLVCGLERARVTAEPNESPIGYGVAYYQDTQALLMRKPRVKQTVELDRAASDIRSTALVAYAGPVPARGMPRVHDIPPFRYGPWMFCLTGALPGGPETREAVEAQLPDSLRRNVQGNTFGERFFHLFLTRLRDAGVSPRSWAAEPDDILNAIARTYASWRLVARPHDERPGEVAVMFSNGQGLGVFSRGRPASIIGLHIEASRMDRVVPETLSAAESDHRGRGASAGWLAVADESAEPAPDGGEVVPDGGMVWIDREHQLHRRALD